jgi:hypothetical protein
MKRSLTRVRPRIKRPAGKLRPVIHDDRGGQTDAGVQPIQDSGHAQAKQRAIDFDRHALTRKVVRDVERAKAAAIRQRVHGEIHRPAFQATCGPRERHPLAACEALTTTSPHLQMHRLVEAMHTLVIHPQAFALEQDL